MATFALRSMVELIDPFMGSIMYVDERADIPAVSGLVQR
jgi:hypothetical protein